MTVALGTSQWWEGRGLLGVGHLSLPEPFPWEENIALRILLEQGFHIDFIFLWLDHQNPFWTIRDCCIDRCQWEGGIGNPFHTGSGASGAPATFNIWFR